MNLPPKEKRFRRKGTKRRVAGRIISQAAPMPELQGECWICGKRVYFWNPWGIKWHNRWWCSYHHPLRPSFTRPYATHSTSYRDRARHERKVDAGLGRKKRKRAKPRKRARDRAYRR